MIGGVIAGWYGYEWLLYLCIVLLMVASVVFNLKHKEVQVLPY